MRDCSKSTIKLYGAIKSVITYHTRIKHYAHYIITMQFQLRSRTYAKTETWISGKTNDTQNTEYAEYEERNDFC